MSRKDSRKSAESVNSNVSKSFSGELSNNSEKSNDEKR